MQGGAIGADDAVSLRSFKCSKAAGDFLLDLGHSHRLFGQIVGERHAGLCHEAPDIIAVITQSANQIGGLALLGSAAFAARQRSGVVALCLRQNCVIQVTQVAYLGLMLL